MGAARIMVVVFASVMMIAAAFVRNGRHGKVRRLVEGGGRDGDHALTPIVTRPGPTSTRWATEAARGCDRKPKIRALLVSCLEAILNRYNPKFAIRILCPCATVTPACW